MVRFDLQERGSLVCAVSLGDRALVIVRASRSKGHTLWSSEACPAPPPFPFRSRRGTEASSIWVYGWVRVAEDPLRRSHLDYTAAAEDTVLSLM